LDCSELEPTSEPRIYTIGGRTYVSVTTVLSIIDNPFLPRWRGDVGNDYADQYTELTAQFGTDVHDMTALLDQGVGMETPPDLEGLCRQWGEWVASNIRRWLLIEEVVWSDVWGFAGRLDRYAEFMTGEVGIVDIKTGRLKKEIGLQTAAYGMAAEERGYPRCERRVAISLDRKTRRLAPKPYTQEGDRDAFLWALGLWRYLRG
jgi:hypothetical protein